MARKKSSTGENAPSPEITQTLDDKNPDFVTAIARGFAILRCFSRKARVIGNKELAERTGLPKSTIARLTFTLTKLGYLEFLPAQEKYSLGIGVLRLGQTYLAGLDLRDVARPLMQELADYSKTTVSLGAPYGQEMVFLEICHGNPMFLLRVEVGGRVPHGMTALGRAYIAALSPEEKTKYNAAYRKIVKASEWPQVSETTVQACRDYEKYGFCFSLGDWNKEVFAVGVPMVSDDGAHILALSCSGPVRDMNRQRLVSDLGPRLMQLRDRIKVKLGGSF
jgi:DNA-binding IclR family transcriptional regulator